MTIKEIIEQSRLLKKAMKLGLLEVTDKGNYFVVPSRLLLAYTRPDGTPVIINPDNVGDRPNLITAQQLEDGFKKAMKYV